MPKGLSKVKQLNQESAARKAAFEEGSTGYRYVSLKDGEEAKVRFLEQGEDVFFLYIHQLPRMPGQQFGQRTPCLDQDDSGQVRCPACERGVRRGYVVVINVIWFDAPKLKRDKDKKVIKDGMGRALTEGAETCVATWTTGPTNADRLQYLDANYQGLSNWIFKIKREGKTKDDTKYYIDPADPTAGPTPFSPQEQQLAANKPDPAKSMNVMTYNDMARAYAAAGDDNGGGQSGPPATQQAPPAGENAFQQAVAGGAVKRGAFGV